MRNLAALCTLAALGAAAGCDDDRTPLQRSCDGEAVGLCQPHAYAKVTAASLTPDGIALGDPTATAMVHVEISTCAAAPGMHEVRIEAFGERGSGLPDAGRSEMLFMLDVVEHDGSGTIDVTITNPFGTDLPPEADLELRFVPFLDPSCRGEALGGIPYRTGPIWVPPPPP